MKITVAVLAHVDAGKTTFSEQVLFRAGAIRAPGRVDHQDAFLDAHPLEKQRGITIFSGQARFRLEDLDVVWLDTPGHVDFSPEMERALAVADYAILVVSAAEGVQSHTETLWGLLREYRVPTFVFLNKTDRAGADMDKCIRDLKRLSKDIADLRAWQNGGMDEALIEEIASRDETLMERLFSAGFDEARWIAGLREIVKTNALFPVFAGSALNGTGIENFLRRFAELARTEYARSEQAPFSARVYQIRRDAQGGRLCFLKLLGGALGVKEAISSPEGIEKINELRLYHGEKFRAVDRVCAGEIVAIPGLSSLSAGQLLGAAATEEGLSFHTQPMMEADVLWNRDAVHPTRMLEALRTLEEEEPTLSVEERQGAISVRVMGRIQLEVLERLLRDRYGLTVTFGPCRVLYRETIAAPCVGVGHYEPLRHYAEVHLRLRPGRPGSGITFRSLCSVDALSRNWQRLVETHVLEKAHKGVLCGEPLTDVEVELLSGRAHIKHTEGGDFRQATYRAIRNALMYGTGVLLEPICRFRLRMPSELYGRVTGDLIRMNAEVDAPEYTEDSVRVTGRTDYARFMAYQETFLSVTHGKGYYECRMDHYAPCHNAREVIEARGYQPLADDTPDSVFCEQGAGFTVPWNEVRAHAHLPVEAAQG